MADSLKVFTNQSGISVNVAATVPYVFNLLTTSASQQAVVRDVALSIVPSDGSPYKFPIALKLGNSVLANSQTGVDVKFNGSQIVDVSSSLTVEILAEEARLDYGTMNAMIPINNSLKILTNSLFSPVEGNGLQILNEATKTDVPISPISSTCGFTIKKNNVTYYCFLGGSTSSYLKIYDSVGNLYQNILLTDTCYWGAVDGTYIYCKPQATSSYLKRVNINTFVVDNQTTGALGTMGNSNPGFMDSYNGNIYIRLAGNDTNINIVSLPSGTITTWSATTNSQPEHIGGLITTTTAGVPYLVEYGDTSWFARNLTTQVSYQGSQVWPTDPSTTNANTMINIAPGIVFVSNAGNSTSCIIDVNFLIPKIFLSTGIISVTSNTGVAYASTPFKQSTYLAKPRVATCSIIASGISVT